jgi:hypothetical protein
MTTRRRTYRIFAIFAAFWVGGCTAPTVMEPIDPPRDAQVPSYAFLPHPPGQTIGDVKFLFTAKNAPSQASLYGCDAPLRAVIEQSSSKDEVDKAARELVKKDPVTYHWCFYGKILSMDNGLDVEDRYIDQKQKRVLTTYEFLAPIARAFMAEYHDSRYLRWAIQDYRRLSELVFFRRLDIAPETSVDIIDAEHPYTGLTPYEMQGTEARSVVEKYYKGDRSPASAVSPSPAPAASPEPVPENEVE